MSFGSPPPLAPGAWEIYAQDSGFAAWLSEIDTLCRRELAVSLAHLDPDMLGAREAYTEKKSAYAFYCYIVWMIETDKLCQHFLGTYLWQLEPLQFAPFDYFEARMQPLQFFAIVIVSALRDEHGHQLIDETIGEAGMWGHRGNWADIQVRGT